MIVPARFERSSRKYVIALKSRLEIRRPSPCVAKTQWYWKVFVLTKYSCGEGCRRRG